MRNEAKEIDLFGCLADWDGAGDSHNSSSEEKDVPRDLEPFTPTGHKKTSHKNKYLNKLKQSGGEVSTSTRRRLNRSEHELEAEIDEEDNKKVKNKMAAKESRDRKKMYIGIIEKETKLLEDEISRVNQ
jgi:hypothetical protein